MGLGQGNKTAYVYKHFCSFVTEPAAYRKQIWNGSYCY